MKACVKATGEIVKVSQYGKHHFLEYIGEKTGRLFLAKELDLLDINPDYWTRLEHTYVGMFMKSFLDNFDGTATMEQLSDDAIALAHALVEKMKEVRK